MYNVSYNSPYSQRPLAYEENDTDYTSRFAMLIIELNIFHCTSYACFARILADFTFYKQVLAYTFCRITISDHAKGVGREISPTPKNDTPGTCGQSRAKICNSCNCHKGSNARYSLKHVLVVSGHH